MEDMPAEEEDNSRKHLNYDKPWRDRMSKKPREKLERDESFLSLQNKRNRNALIMDGVKSNPASIDGPNTDLRGQRRMKGRSVVDNVPSD